MRRNEPHAADLVLWIPKRCGYSRSATTTLLYDGHTPSTRANTGRSFTRRFRGATFYLRRVRGNAGACFYAGAAVLGVLRGSGVLCGSRRYSLPSPGASRGNYAGSDVFSFRRAAPHSADHRQFQQRE